MEYSKKKDLTIQKPAEAKKAWQSSINWNTSPITIKTEDT